MKFKGFTLDKFQEDSIAAVEKNYSVLVSAPTGSGKTLTADYIIDKELTGSKRVIYTAPIKALSNQKYLDFTNDYGRESIGLITGDTVINPEAQILIMTTEVYRNMAIVKDPVLDDVSYCIMDEIHFINDEERGHIWEESIIFGPPHVRFLFLSATIPNADEFADWVAKVKEHEVKVIHHDVRPVPLNNMFFDSELGITTLDAIKDKKDLDSYPQMKNIHSKRRKSFHKPRIKVPDFRELVKELNGMDKFPCIYFVFSRKKTQDYASTLARTTHYTTRAEQTELVKLANEEFKDLNPEIMTLKSSQLLKQCIQKGIAFHHAGILPDLKHIVEKLFGMGLIKVLFATETFAVGINYPAKTVCFDGLRKYTGTGFRYLTSKEYFQIAGRAGRRGIDTEGLSVSIINRNSFDYNKIKSFTDADTMPIKSQFKLSYNTVLNLIKLHTPEEIDEVLKMNFFTYQSMKGNIEENVVLSSIKARYLKRKKMLEKWGYIDEDVLTGLGEFTTRIYSDEITVSQIFGTDICDNFDEYDVLLILAIISYEEKKGFNFKNFSTNEHVQKIRRKVAGHPILRNDKRFKNAEIMTAIINPCHEQEGFLALLKNTSMLEGDVIRLFMQVVDKLEQVDRAIVSGSLKDIVKNSKHLIHKVLEGFVDF